MKKFMSILLILAMVLAMSTTVFATTITIDGEENSVYNGYQLLKLTTSLKGDDHHPEECNGVEHSDDCYNYAYTVNEKYSSILQKEVFDNGGNYLWNEGKPTDSSKVTDVMILDYLKNQTSDNGDVYLTMRHVADRIYRDIQARGIEADEKNIDAKNTNIEQGYWMFADVTELDGNKTNSLVMVDTLGQSDLKIVPKTALPSIEKKVKDIDDSEDDKIADNPWLDTADHDINDSVPFKLTATLPGNVQYYKTYKVIMHDTMAEGLTFDKDSVKVLMYETKHKADVDTDLNDQLKDVTDLFTVTEIADGTETFTVSCDNVLGIEGVTKDTAFVVYYEAVLNQAAVVGGEGNLNEVYMEFSNDPYGTGTGETKVDKVAVYTYELVINKTDSHDHPLAGAGFTLYKKVLKGNEVKYVALGEELKGDGMTTFNWSGLDDGDYKLEESTVPAGYNKMSDIVFSISAEHSEVNGKAAVTLLDGGLMGEGDVVTGKIEKNIVNNTGTILPETGAMGTMILIFSGALLVAVAAVFMITRKKMSVFED